MSGKGDERSRGQGQVQRLAVNIDIDQDARSQGEDLLDGDLGARAHLGVHGGVVEEVDPDGHLGTDAQVQAHDVEAGGDGDARAQAEADLELDVDVEGDVGADGQGRGRDDEADQVLLDNLLGDDVDLDVAALGEVDVEDGLEVDGGGQGQDEVEGEADLDAALEEAGDVEREVQVLPDVDGRFDVRSGVNGNLQVGLDTAEVDLQRGRQEEVNVRAKTNGALERSLGERDTEVDAVGALGARCKTAALFVSGRGTGGRLFVCGAMSRKQSTYPLYTSLSFQ